MFDKKIVICTKIDSPSVLYVGRNKKVWFWRLWPRFILTEKYEDAINFHLIHSLFPIVRNINLKYRIKHFESYINPNSENQFEYVEMRWKIFQEIRSNIIADVAYGFFPKQKRERLLSDVDNKKLSEIKFNKKENEINEELSFGVKKELFKCLVCGTSMKKTEPEEIMDELFLYECEKMDCKERRYINEKS